MVYQNEEINQERRQHRNQETHSVAACGSFSKYRLISLGRLRQQNPMKCWNLVIVQRPRPNIERLKGRYR